MSYKIKFVILAGKTFTMEVDPSITFETIQRSIEVQCEIPLNFQQISYENKILDTKILKTIKDLNLPKFNETYELVVAWNVGNSPQANPSQNPNTNVNDDDMSIDSPQDKQDSSNNNNPNSTNNNPKNNENINPNIDPNINSSNAHLDADYALAINLQAEVNMDGGMSRNLPNGMQIDETPGKEFSFPNYEFNENKVDGKLLDQNTTNELFTFLWGNGKKEDIERWFSQGIDFSIDEDRTRFGLVQLYGGPCGVLAPVQGYIMKELLFDSSLQVILEDDSDSPVLPNDEQREEALVRALTEIMKKCAVDPTFFTWVTAVKHEHFFIDPKQNQNQNTSNPDQNTNATTNTNVTTTDSAATTNTNANATESNINQTSNNNQTTSMTVTNENTNTNPNNTNTTQNDAISINTDNIDITMSNTNENNNDNKQETVESKSSQEQPQISQEITSTEPKPSESKENELKEEKKQDSSSLFEERTITKIWIKELESLEDLKKLIYSSLPLLKSRMGVVAFVFSILLSKTLHVIKEEMDNDFEPLVLEQFGHCSQEIVNLVLTGRAVTNVHDGNKTLSGAAANGDTDEFLLKGIAPDQELGFLSTLEAMRLARVGDHYKTPKYPIWIVGSSSHYSILFGLNINIGKISKHEKLMQNIKRFFHEIDQEEQGFIHISKLPILLKKCKLDNLNVNSIRGIIDPDNTDHIFRQTFMNNFQRLKEATIQWQCNICTYHNDTNLNSCSMCTQLRKEPVQWVLPPESPKAKEPIIPKTFTLYHYNGLKSTKKDKPQLTKLKVFDDHEITNFSAIAEELTALIRTKWEYAVVEFDGPYRPKIQ